MAGNALHPLPDDGTGWNMAYGVFPILNVSNLDKSIEWYKGLGLDVREEREADMRWASVESGEHALVLFPRDFPGASDEARSWASGDVGKGVLLNIGVPDARKSWEKAQAIRAEVDEALEEQPWGGRAFTVVDPDGYVLSLSDRFPGEMPGEAKAKRTPKKRAAKKGAKKTAKKRPAKAKKTARKASRRTTKKRR